MSPRPDPRSGLIALGLMFCIGPAAASATDGVLTGVVRAGPCPGALTFVTTSGARFEMQEGPFARYLGKILRVQGTIYPHISICRRYPWLRPNALSIANGTGAGSSVSKPILQEIRYPVQVELMAGPGNLGKTIQDAAQLQARFGRKVKVAIDLNGANGASMARAMLALSRDNMLRLNQVTVRQGTGGAIRGARVADGVLAGRYASIQALEEKMARFMAHDAD